MDPWLIDFGWLIRSFIFMNIPWLFNGFNSRIPRK